MVKYRHPNGREFDINLTYDAAKAVKEGPTGFDFLAYGEAYRLANDAYLRIDVLWELVRAQAEAAGLDKAAFTAALVDENDLDVALDVLFEALENFTPKVGRILRQHWSAAKVEQHIRLEELAVDLAKPSASAPSGPPPAECSALSAATTDA